MKLSDVPRWLLAICAALIIIWSFVDVGARTWRLWADRLADPRPVLTVLHWGDNAEIDIVQSTIDAFEEKHPEIRVQRLHASDYDSKLKTMLAAGTPPDLFYLRYEDLPDFAQTQMLLDLEPYIARDREEGQAEWVDDVFPILLNAYRWNDEQRLAGSGTLYGIPKDFTPLLMYANLDLFNEAGVEVPYDGWTWTEFREAMRKIAALGDPDDPNRRVYGGIIKTWPSVIRTFFWNFDGEYFGGPEGNEFSNVALDEPGAQETLDFIRTLRMEDKSIFNATGLSQDEDDLFRRGRIGIIAPVGRWYTPRFRQIDEFDWDVIPIPHKEGVEPTTGIATVAWSIASQSKHPEAAYTLLKFLCAAEGQQMIAEQGLAVPSRMSVAYSDDFLAPGLRPKNAELYLELAETARLAQVPTNNRFDQILDTELAKTLRLNELTPAEAAAEIERQWLAELASPLQTKEYPLMPWRTLAIVAGVILVIAVTAGAYLARRQQLGAIDRAQERTGFAFISPWLLGFVVFLLGPLMVSLLLSLTSWSAMAPLSAARFVGFDNYVHLFTYDEQVWQALWVTFYYTVLAVPIVQTAAILVAVMMNARVPGIAFFRTAYFVPSVVTGVALVTLWITIFNNDQGLLNMVLRNLLAPFNTLLGTTLEPPDWFGVDGAVFAMPALVLMTLWGVGGGMIIYLAGLKNIPDSLYEAARIDGANAISQFINITIPMLSPLIFFNVIMGIIGSFQVFTQAYVIRGSTGGTDENLLFYVLYLYDHAFRNHNMGYASALAWVLFLIVLVFTLFIFRGSRGMVHYEGLKS
ncbi:extracellular solute-binding protein [Mucisphaera calidilacus]|uniref:Lactose transport system permease protein LacF n=1 Tax=Mucisphaera calidilacus TaxID=2527982 RepID=A0A518BVC6_9BACT|nr:extracellular solute-binding protein [Mucisphaera calidilacus]QDU70943.1 Lactose transport system permease protein LacF [Mucisphaera calidilacus]